MKKIFLITVAHLLLVSCGSSTPFDRGRSQLELTQSTAQTPETTPEDPVPVVLDKNMFVQSVAPIMESSCTVCHSNPTPTFEAAKNLVVVGSPSESLLIIKAQGLDGHPEIFAADAPELGVIKSWILGGTVNP